MGRRSGLRKEDAHGRSRRQHEKSMPKERKKAEAFQGMEELTAQTNGDKTPILGGHVAGGLKRAVKKAEEIGAQVMQIFLGSPQTWKEPSPPVADIKMFVRDLQARKLGPLFVHGNYLVNLAGSDADNLYKSVLNLRSNLFLADQIGAKGVIFHPGSAGQRPRSDALKQVVKAMDCVLDGYGGKCKLVIEVCAGQGGTIGDNFREIGALLKGLDNDKRLAVCWDTCHLFSAGYNIASKEGLEKTVAEFDEEVGFQWLMAIHANDSKTPLGSRRDRHENIGKGFIGEEAFARMLHHPVLRDKPWILEVPGFENKGPDRANIDILRRLAS
ncbi:MAG TPA: deoxyribonuclease IV [Candidatus Obscuribacterales bacterium]